MDHGKTALLVEPQLSMVDWDFTANVVRDENRMHEYSRTVMEQHRIKLVFQCDD